MNIIYENKILVYNENDIKDVLDALLVLELFNESQLDSNNLIKEQLEKIKNVINKK